MLSAADWCYPSRPTPVMGSSDLTSIPSRTMSPVLSLLLASSLALAVAPGATLVVLNAGNSGAGSLRQAIVDAAPGDVIHFAPGLSGQTITLASPLSIGKALTIDATGLANGIIISGNNTVRVIEVTSGQTVALTALVLTGGIGELGGGVYNEGNLTVTRTTIAGNTAGFGGGGVCNFGTLALNQSTISGNSRCLAGGGIYNVGTLTMTGSTIAGNSADLGGGIYNESNATATHCTISGNSAVSAGGILSSISTVLVHTIVAGNTAGSVPEINGSFSATHCVTSGNPQLSPLGNFGGPTLTMAPLPGSPARNAAVGSAVTGDQRGFAIVGTPDIGAYEAGTLTNYLNFIWESLPTAGNGLLTDPGHAATFDFDSDGQNNGDEWVARTEPANSTSYLHITQIVRGAGSVSVTFPSVPGRSYRLQTSPDLVVPWSNLGTITPGTGGPVTFTAATAGLPRRFYRVTVGDP